MPQTMDVTSHPVSVYRQSDELSLCILLECKITLEVMTSHFNILDLTQLRNHFPYLQAKHEVNALLQCYLDGMQCAVC